MSRWHNFDFPDLPERAFTPRGGRGRFAGPMTLEGGGKGSAPAPDPRMGEAALKQIELNEKIFQDYQLNDRPWMQNIANEALGLSRSAATLARDQFSFSRDLAGRQLDLANEQLGILRSQAERANALSDYQLDMMRFNDQRYRNVAVPFEDQLLSDVKRFDSEAYKNDLARAAVADVGRSFDNARLQAARNAGRMGVDRVLRATNDVGLEKAKAEAAAMYKTRQAADQIGLSNKMQMYGGMRGLAGLGASNAQLAAGAMGAGTGAISAGMGALNAGVGALGAGNSALGIMGNSAAGMLNAGSTFLGANNAAQGAMNSGISAGISGLGNYTALGQNAAKINAENDPFNTILGAATGVGLNYLLKSDRRLKTDIIYVGVDPVTGLNLYEFRYINGSGRRYRGVMADEVEAKYPGAVFTMPDGYKAVNYAVLGLELVQVDGGTK